MTAILVAGGAGYVGSHTVVKLLEKNQKVIIADDFSHSNLAVISAIQAITGQSVKSYRADLTQLEEVKKIFDENEISGVINLAGYKSVGESSQMPLHYYRNNLEIMLNLLTVMEEYDVYRLVFSSSATVYGNPKELPVKESAQRKPTNTYGRTKVMIEQILQDLAESDSRWRFISLRFFNPLGAHKSSNLGEDPNGLPNNLAPYITQVAIGKLPKLQIYGHDFPTPDGTSVRDYLHIDDLAAGHVAAMNNLLDSQDETSRFEAINLGSGKGYSVLEILQAFEEAIGKKIPFDYTEKRLGDTAESFASIEKAKRVLDWVPTYTIEEMCQDTWHWQLKHPNGYDNE
ncbi:UDP-glucose 4-epimerase GalE [Enterococcus sp. BWR-S5]|uniref:UDP-glucose 4-epimerase GalE n=1 Tax=Enterococcus sp. BWR-S5 TaxID=2787714 RepID=UPI00192363B0|nr:UDP-glucose 4-epimerase GalE [Enterococcus sp. BWR-S5]MBL1224648.1 UDP-glucose 4-epimerase GalE [Enterococcus sp. BWR-S5]